MAKRANSINWAKIELEYLSGDCSIREIADRYEVSESAIRKRAKVNKWPREVRSAQKVRTTAHYDLEAKIPAPAPSDPENPRELTSIADDGRNLVGRMLDELDLVTSHRGELEDMIAQVTEDDSDDARRDAMLKALSLSARANTLKTLALSLKAINEASAPQGKKAAKQEQADKLAGVGRFSQLGPPTLKAVK